MVVFFFMQNVSFSFCTFLEFETSKLGFPKIGVATLNQL